jgi:hypothetical protein
MLDDNGRSVREGDRICSFILLFLIALIPSFIEDNILFIVLAMCAIGLVTFMIIAFVIVSILDVLKRIQPFKYIYELYW